MGRGASSFKWYKSIRHRSGNVEGHRWIDESGVHWGGGAVWPGVRSLLVSEEASIWS